MDNHERNDIHIGCAMALVLGIIWILIWFAIYSILESGPPASRQPWQKSTESPPQRQKSPGSISPR